MVEYGYVIRFQAGRYWSPKKRNLLEIACLKSLKVLCNVYENIPYMTVLENEIFCTTFVIINLGLDPDSVNTDP